MQFSHVCKNVCNKVSKTSISVRNNSDSFVRTPKIFTEVTISMQCLHVCKNVCNRVHKTSIFVCKNNNTFVRLILVMIIKN